MAVENLEIYETANTIILDSVTFCVDFNNAEVISIQQHPQGACFVCGAARAMLSETDVQKLIAVGVTDLR